jgi:hypothetical protein
MREQWPEQGGSAATEKTRSGSVDLRVVEPGVSASKQRKPGPWKFLDSVPAPRGGYYPEFLVALGKLRGG